MGHGEVVVEGGELRVFGKYACDVVGIDGGGGKEEEKEGENEGGGERWRVWHCVGGGKKRGLLGSLESGE